MNNKAKKLFTVTLSDVQLDRLSSSTMHPNKMQCLMSLVRQASTEALEYKRRGFSAFLQVGQVALSEVELSHIWHCNRKTASKIIDEFNRIGVISSVQGNRTSIHTVLCIKNFTVDGIVISTPFFKTPD